ncbi:MAG: zinc ribbon domain-containing protein [Myxococcota bacterium]|nr:zinc ribbon domain-containing protein [Myxococcota bacterium]
MPRCSRCGNTQIRQEALFCDLCGTRLLASPLPGPTAGSQPSLPVVPAGRTPSRPPLSRTGAPPSRPPSGPRTTWRELELQGEIPDELNIEGVRWVKVDELEPRNRESEVAHGWTISETRQIFQERGAKSYPDGVEASCRGYLVKGGITRFTIKNLAPGAPVAMVRQAWAEGREQGEVYVGEYTAGTFAHQDLDLNRPMRNRIHLIPRSIVTGNELTVEQEDLGSENGLYYFGLKFFQPGDVVDALSSAVARAAATGNIAAGDAAPVKVIASGTTMSWESIKRLGRGLPDKMKLGGKEWELVDWMSFDDKQSPEDHTFAVYDAENYYTQKVKGTYPDGESVEDAGIRWDTGYAEWTVGDTFGARDLAIIVRLDVRELPGPVEVLCDERSAGLLQVEGRDPVNRWRNWSHIVPAKLVSENGVRIRFALPEGSTGMNMFRLWFYQTR